MDLEIGLSDLCWTSDGKNVVTAADDGILRVWDPNDERNPVSRLRGHLSIAFCCRASPVVGSALLASGSFDESIRLWDMRGASPDSVVSIPVSSSMDTSGNGDLDVNVSENNIFNYNCTVDVPVKSAKKMGGSQALLGSSTTFSKINPKACLRTISAHGDPVTGVSFTADATLLASSSYDGLLRLWDVRTGQCCKTMVSDDSAAPLGGVTYSLNGQFVMAPALDSTVRIWRVNNGKVVRAFKGHVNRKFCLKTEFITLGSKQMLICGNEEAAGSFSVWDLNEKSGKPINFEGSSSTATNVMAEKFTALACYMDAADQVIHVATVANSEITISTLKMPL